MTVFLLLLGLSISANAQKCLEYGASASLTGTLRSQVFAGPPNYESIKRGDRKETAILLLLVVPPCITSTDREAVDVPEIHVRKMQLIVTKDAHWKTIRRLIGKRATVTGTLIHAHTGHHRTKVLIDTADIRASI